MRGARSAADAAGIAGLTLAIAGALLAFTIKIPDAYGIPKLIAAGFGALVAWAAIERGAAPGERLRPGRTGIAVAACWAVVAVAAVFSEDPPRSVAGAYVFFLYGLLPVSIFASLFFAAKRVDSPEAVLATLRLGLAAAGLCGLYGALQAFGIEPFLPAASAGTISGRVISSMGGPVYLGSALVPFAPAALYFSLRSDPRDKAAGLAATAAVWAGLFFSGSRGAMIAAGAGCLFAWIAGRRDASRVFLSRKNLAAFGAALVLAGVLVGLSAGGSRNQADRARVEVWKTAVRVAAAHPLLGVGPDAFQIGFRRFKTERFVAMLGPTAGQADAHNDLLQIAATTGAAGLAAYGFLLWALGASLARALSREESDRPLIAALGGALIGGFLQAKVNPVSFSLVVTASVFAGWIANRSGEEGEGPGLRASARLMLVLCAAALLLSADLFHTDRLRQTAETARAKGDMDTTIVSYRKAIRRNPFYSEYGSSYGTVLAMLVREAPAEVRVPLAKEFFKLARLLKRRHPGDVRGPHMAGLACLVGGTLAGEDCLESALSDMARARALDPFSPTVLQDSADLARLAGDDGAAAGFEARRADILAMRGRNSR